ncbi:nuclear transport factor 2 family protein [Mycobacterium sp. 663a-19]|uniref:Rv0361 family membrane protein n=1 Tax=Mycobacterium sp. 663a-19 TaxID=2986148 RepID=UPI002D1ED0B4|nr:nuclear transport factor 2 family protein [Mycobacterium sp. 663a-19]MEB3982145.1 nuclear transport factor 2 family protein [Mycobacterium sp. 663a-19]
MNRSVLATAAATVAVAAVTASCSTVTGGSPVAQHSGAAATAPARATAPAPTAAPVAPPSAEDQIRQTVMAFQDAYNTQNWDAYTDLMCSAMRAQFTGPVMNYVKKGRAETGLTTIKAITSVTITGNTATATMDAQNEALGSRSVSLPLKLEDGWKICKT